MVIGIPKEIMRGENRVAATPETVAKLAKTGATVLLETGAGRGSFFTDDEYREAGAGIVAHAEEIFAKGDLILKVKEPQFNPTAGKHEVEMMRPGQCLISFLHPASPQNHETVRALAAQGVTALTLDSVPRISRAQPMDALTSMSTVAGYKAVLAAANRLPKFFPMVATAVGTIQPAQVLVVGAGVAGLQALATAKRLGAVVRAADIRPDACEQARSLGAQVVELGVPEEVAVGDGGYAQKLPAEWLEKERLALAEPAAKADVIVLTALIPGRRAPVLVTEAMVRAIAPGSAIADVAVDQGGNCELTEAGQVVEKHGVSIDGTLNIPGSVPVSATWLFANNMYHFFAYLLRDGKLHVDPDDPVVGPCLVTKDGEVVHRGALEAMGSVGSGSG